MYTVWKERCEMLGLPEIEGYRKQLDQLIVGGRIHNLHIEQKSWPNIDAVIIQKGIHKRQILFVERRGTELIFHLDDGRRLVLCMTPENHLHIFHTDAVSIQDLIKQVMNQHDQRKLQLFIYTERIVLVIKGSQIGNLFWLTAKQLHDRYQGLGPDPLSKGFSLERFSQRFAKRRMYLKSALINPTIIIGIGNDYADEIAYAAGLLPTARIEQFEREHWKRLYHAMLAVFQQAIEQAEVIDKPSLSTSGGLLTVKPKIMSVYGREGQLCNTCDQEIQIKLIQRRPAYFCPTCQVAPGKNE